MPKRVGTQSVHILNGDIKKGEIKKCKRPWWKGRGGAPYTTPPKNSLGY